MSISSQTSLRERQKAELRDLIIDAALEAMAENAFDRATHDMLAERVGVARRTVYRYFPDRDSLLQAAWDRVNYNPKGAAYGLPTDKASVVDALGDFYEVAEENALAVTVAMTSPQGRALRATVREARARAWRGALKEEVEKLPEEERDLPLAALQLLRSGFAWLEFGDQWKLGMEDKIKAARWATRVLLADLEARGGRPLEEGPMLEVKDGAVRSGGLEADIGDGKE